MKFKDVIYPLITDRIEIINASIDAKLDAEGDNENLEECYDILSDVVDQITQVYSDDVGDPCLVRLHAEISSSASFSTANLKGWCEFLFLLEIAKTIESDGGIDIENEIGLDDADFVLGEYNGTELPSSALAYHNPIDPANSLAYIKTKSSDIINDIEDSGFTNGLLCLVLHFLADLGEDLKLNNQYILYRKDAHNITSAESALKMQVALQGRVIHRERPSHSMNAQPSILNRISALHPYNQFEETLIIISELNKSNGILGTFLSMYHVIESFMFKIPIVNLGEANNGNIFSLRDFRRLSESVKEREMPALAGLFKKDEMGKFWERNIDGTTFDDIVSGEVTSLIPPGAQWSDSDCENFLSHLNVKGISSYNNLCNNLNADRYAQIIYKVRCAIVHNKETELHLSYFNITETVERIINYVLIKPLLLLISDLLTDSGSKVWYRGPELKLYQT